MENHTFFIIVLQKSQKRLNFAEKLNHPSSFACVRRPEDTIILSSRNFMTKLHHLFFLPLFLFSLVSKAQTSAIPRVQVIEEATGTWCGWCVRGIVGMNQLEEKYPDTFIGLAIHGDDAYACESYAPFLQRIAGYPFAIINRSFSCGTKPEEMLTAYEAMTSMGDAEGEAKIVDAHYTDSKYSAIEVTVESRFAKSHTKDDYRLSFVVVEDSIRDRQANYYAGGAYGEMGGFEALSDYPYVYLRHVARHIEGYDGIPGSIPTKISADETYTYTHTIPMPKVKMRSRVSLVVLLLRDQGVSIVNANRMRKIASYVPDGIRRPELDADESSAIAYDLQGRAFTTPQKGISIINGRKVIR